MIGVTAKTLRTFEVNGHHSVLFSAKLPGLCQFWSGGASEVKGAAASPEPEVGLSVRRNAIKWRADDIYWRMAGLESPNSYRCLEVSSHMAHVLHSSRLQWNSNGSGSHWSSCFALSKVISPYGGGGNDMIIKLMKFFDSKNRNNEKVIE